MGAGHTHDVGPAAPRLRRIMTWVMVPLVVATVVAVALLWPRGAGEEAPPDNVTRYGATVTQVREEVCTPDEAATSYTPGRCGTVTVRVAEGPDAGREITTPVPDGPGAPTVRAGDAVVLVALFDPADPTESEYAIADHQRGSPLLLLVGLFAAVIIGFGRWRGVRALAGLATCFTLLLSFILPAIIDGRPPLLVAVVGAAMVIFVVMYLVHGVSVRTSVAVLGTLGALVLTGVLGVAATAATHLTGFGTEEAGLLSMLDSSIDLRGLLLAGIIIGSVGVLDDVTVTQATAVGELARANPALSRRQLYLAGARVGRAHIASVVNTIVLAYAGASLPVLLLIVAGPQAVGNVLTSEFIGQEIVRSAVGTIGLIAAVPLTTVLAAVVCRQAPDGAGSGEPAAGERPPGRLPRHRAEPGEALAASRPGVGAEPDDAPWTAGRW